MLGFAALLVVLTVGPDPFADPLAPSAPVVDASPDGGVLLNGQAIVLGHAERAVEKASVGLRASLPPSLTVRSVLGLELWQWLGMPLLLVVDALVSFLFSAFSLWLFTRFARKNQPKLEASSFADLIGPVRLLWLFR